MMALQNFVDGVGPVVASAWLNPVDQAINGTAAGQGAALVPYLPPGTGAVTRTVSAKLQESVSVLDFGADPTGVTDSTAAIQAAINAAYNIFLPAGTYIISGVTVSNYGTKIFGTTGNGRSILQIKNAAGAFGIQLVSPSGSGTHFVSKFRGQDFDIVASAGSNQQKGLWCNNADLRLLDHVNINMAANTFVGTVRNGTYALYGYFQQNGVFTVCTFTGGSGAFGDGVFLTGVINSASPNSNIFINCNAQSSGGYGVRNSLGFKNIWFGGSINANTGGGWIESDDGFGNGPLGTLIIGTSFEANNNDDFHCDTANNPTIRECSFQSVAATYHVNVTYAINGIFVNNISTSGKPVNIAGGSNNRWGPDNLTFGARTFTTGTMSSSNVQSYVGLSYSTTIAVDASLGSTFAVVVTNTTAFTLQDPSNPSVGQIITVFVSNQSGGVMGTITWGTGGTSSYQLAGAFTNPANGKRRTISFVFVGTGGGGWIETGRAAADI